MRRSLLPSSATPARAGRRARHEAAQQPAHVQNERHAAVARDRRAGDPGQAAEQAPERFQHCLALSQQAIDAQAHAPGGVAHHDHALALGRRALDPEQPAQAHERQRLAAQVEHALAGARGARVRGQVAALGHGVQRDHEALARDAHAEALDDHQRQRQAQAHAGAQPGARLDLHRALQRLDVAAHDVHAHAAARQLADALGGREAGAEDQLEQLALGQALDALHAERAGARAHAVERDPGPVVVHFDHHAAGLVTRAQRHAAHGVLAGELAPRGRLEAMVERVAHHVRERVADGFHQRQVEFGFLALETQTRALAGELGQVAHAAREAPEGRADRHQARLEHDLVQLARQALGGLEGLERPGFALRVPLGQRLAQQRLGAALEAGLVVGSYHERSRVANPERPPRALS